jgi:lysophospholipase L1-like esterase
MAKTDNLRILKFILIVSLLLNVIAAIYAGRKIYNKYQTKTYSPPPKWIYYLNRDKLFDVLTADSNAIIFLGNSLTQYFELAELFQNAHVKNRGIHGDMIEGALARLTPIIQSHPKKIFIEIGINDLEQGHTKERLLNNYQRLIDTLKATCPATQIYIQSLLPVTDSSSRLPNYCSPKMNAVIREVNAGLKQYASTHACTYIDVHTSVLEGNQLAPKYSIDGVHLSGEGYLMWAKILKKHVGE